MFWPKQTVKYITLTAILLPLIGAACTPVATTSTAGGNNEPTVTQVDLQESNAGTITVVGRGEAFGQPDEAHAQIGVETFAREVNEATAQNEAAIEAIMETLREQGIAAEDIQTSNYNLWAEQRYGENGPEGIAGYRVNNQLSVTMRDIDKVSEVLTAVTAAGANSIYGVTFSVADSAALEAEARAAAMDDARERAASLAELSGVTLGDIQIVTEVIGQPYAPFYGLGGGGGSAQDLGGGPSVSPGQLSYQVQVQVTFQIQ